MPASRTSDWSSTAITDLLFFRLCRFELLLSFASTRAGDEGVGFDTGGAATRFGFNGLGLTGLYRSRKWRVAGGRAPWFGNGVDGAGEGVEGTSEIDFRFLVFSAFFELMEGDATGDELEEAGEVAEPIVGIPDDTAGLGCSHFELELDGPVTLGVGGLDATLD